MRQGSSVVETLIIEQIPAMRRYAHALARDRGVADDLVQDALLRAIKAQHQWQAGTNMRRWLFAILHNVYRLHRRTMGRRPGLVSLDDAQYRLPVQPSQPAAVALGEFERALSLLPESQRMTMLLVGLEGASYAEAAAIMRVPIGTVRSRFSRARQTLAHVLGMAGTDVRMTGNENALIVERDPPAAGAEGEQGGQPGAEGRQGSASGQRSR